MALVKRPITASDGQQAMAIRVVRPGSGNDGGNGREEPHEKIA
ncbi:MAG: hypothetical protein ACP5UD_08955 [Conexivisphaera sp.]|jgi:hypothetical protein